MSNAADYNALARLCKSTGDPLRLEILRAMKTDSFGVLELCDIFAIKQSGMSHHLKVLANAGAVDSRREGNSIFYRRTLVDTRTPPGLLLSQLFTSLDLLPLSTDIQQRIDTVRAQRAEAARAFFSRYAGDFHTQQALIAPLDQYAEHALQLLLREPISDTDLVMEIGPGEGEFLVDLATHFNQVIALDISTEMLQAAKAQADAHQLCNIRFCLGDTHTALQEGLSASHIVCNMTLHHVPSPAALFSDVASLLSAGGSFVVTDLCHHDQPWVRDACGDLWQGFEPAELAYWAQRAGLAETDSLYLGLRNGFQIQVRKFVKPLNLSQSTH